MATGETNSAPRRRNAAGKPPNTQDAENAALPPVLAPSRRRHSCTRRRTVAGLLVGVLVLSGGDGYAGRGQVRGEAFADPAFARVWRRTDAPVQAGGVARTWVWGPEPRTGGLTEPYRDTPGGQRLVQYFDKSRMELNDPRGDANAPFFVTNGLLVVELITGNLQLGADAFTAHPPSTLPVAGDLDDPNGPTYAAFARVRALPPLPVGMPITATLARDGSIGADTRQAGRATARQYVGETRHTVADVFWAFMNAHGPVDGSGSEPLFRSPFYATGFPLTEAYWATVRVAGQPRPVLMQVFERRVLTYTPGNPPGFEVEAGNVGLHYRLWRAGLPAATRATATASTTPVTTAIPSTPNGAARPTLAALIVEVVPAGAGGETNGERITLANGSDRPLDLRDWTVRDTRGHVYRFGAFTLPVDGTVSLLSGNGVDSPTTRYWNQAAPILHDGPETISVHDATGTLVDAYPYP